MRALKSQRLLTPAEKKTQARSRRAAPRRRKPPPRWRRPALWAAGMALGLAAVASAGLWLWQAGYPTRASLWLDRAAADVQLSLGLSVQEVLLTGRTRTPRERVVEALAISRGVPILSLDIAAARTRLEAIGWIKAAAVSRRLPQTIDVRIIERRPLALWQRQGRLVLVGDDGGVIGERPVAAYRDLPIVVGPTAPVHTGPLLAVLRGEPDLYRRVEALVHVAERRWNVRLDNGVEVRLPEGEEASAWSRLAALDRDHDILARDVRAIDLRLPDRLVVRLAPGGAERLRDPGRRT